jgi:hypothetical protein
MTFSQPLQLSWGAARVELRAERPRLRAILAHVFRSFVPECAEDLVVDANDAGDREAWTETWTATLDGCEYSYSNLGEAVRELEYEVGEKLLTDISDGLLLHSAAVTNGDRTIMVLGPSGSGKTTLSLELVRRGYRFITDEYVAVEPTGATLRPFPRSAVLKEVVNELPPGAHVVCDGDRHYRSYLMPHHRSDLAPMPLHEVWLIFATHRKNGRAHVRHMETGEVFANLLKSTFRFEGRAAELWPAMSAIATRATACAFEYHDGPVEVDLALDWLGRK